MSDTKKSAFVAIIGRPSSGKSTFLNTVCEGKVSIVSKVPQTTRNRIRGIVTKLQGQLVFLDTPGYHDSDKKFNLHLRDLAKWSVDDADIVLYMIDSTRKAGKEEEAVAALVKTAGLKLVCAMNKMDDPGSDMPGTRAFLNALLPETPVREISAKSGTNVAELIELLLEMSPEGPEYYPSDLYTDQEPEFRITEIIREKAILNTRDEIPHAVYAEIADAEFNEDKSELNVRAFLVTERDSQKGMLIGKGAVMIKKIRLDAEKDLNDIFPYRINLDLQVKVDKNWRQHDALVKKLVF